MTLRGRLFLTIGLAVLLSVALSLGVGAFLARRSIQQAVETNLSRQVDLLAVRAETQPLSAEQLSGLRFFLGRQGERLVVTVRPVPAGLPVSAEQRSALDAGRAVQGELSLQGVPLLFAAHPTDNQVLLLVRPARLGAADWRPFLGSFLVAGLVGVAVAAAASFLLALVIAGPVGRVAEASRRLASGAPTEPVPVEGSDELAVLSRSFNDMAEQLAKAREGERGFLLSVSHELKTPLTAIRGYGEALEEGAVEGPAGGEVITREAARLERLVQDLLDLARLSQRTFSVRREVVDLGSVVEEAVRRHEPQARAFGVALAGDATEPCRATADPDRILQVVSNLIENAVRSTPSGGSVTVSAGPGVVAVRDTGPGLSSEDAPRAFERFFLYRRYSGERAVGTGLGLAIVKELTEAMGGSVSVDSVPGEGTTFTVRLPTPAARPDVVGQVTPTPAPPSPAGS